MKIAEVFEETQGSRPDATYAIGDLHGELTLLRRLLTLIDPGPADTLVFLGGNLDRGEGSVGTVRGLHSLARIALYPCVFPRGIRDAAWLEAWGEQSRVSTEVGRFLEGMVTAHGDEHAYYAHAAA